MLFMRNYNCLQQLFFINMRYLFFCITVFAALSNHIYLLAQNTCEAVASIPKKMGDDEFKLLVENIYELLLHENSVDEIVEMLDGDQTIPYNTKKLVTHINDLLNKQNSKGTVINIVVNNNGSKEYCSRANFLNLLMHATNYYFALKVVACILAFVVACILLAQYISGESGFLKGKPKPKNQCDAKNINEKSNDHELPNPNISNNDDTLQPDERQEEYGHEIPVQEAQEIRPEAAQTNHGVTVQAVQGTNQADVLASDETGPIMVQKQHAPSVIRVKKVLVGYEIREKTHKMVDYVISLFPDFEEPPYVDISLSANKYFGPHEQIDTRKLREIIGERIDACERLLNSA